MGFVWTLALLFAIQIFDIIKKAVLDKDCTEQNDIQKDKNLVNFTLDWMCDWV